ncbi:MAG: LysM peptidoglycan-binding domain-containing protein [Rhodospirillales bacterium]|nr:LysM peptidoglycan-binding domain-containing protein [Rhodospirillales bacterium]
MDPRVADTDSHRWFVRPALVAGAGLLAVLIAIGLNFLPQRELDKAEAPAPPASVSTPATPAAPVGADNTAPVFDVVRINPQGDTVIAGRAEPGALVVLNDGGTSLGEVSADGRGEWVFVPETPLPPGDHRLHLEMRRPDGQTIGSQDDVLVLVPAPGEDIAGRPASAAQPLALRLPRGDGPTTVLQKPSTNLARQALSIDSIDYDEQGHIALSGQAPPAARVRLNIDGKTAGEATADTTGVWRIVPQRSIGSDLHTLAIEQLNDRGESLARVAVPLMLASSAEAGRPGPQQVIVQPGQNLWRIARARYGKGTSYTIIFEANRTQIADPDLIYPGQVFHMPSSRSPRKN